METMLLLMSVFIAIVILMIIIRAKSGSRFEVKNSDILIALIPIAMWLLLTGKVKVLEFGGLKIESAFVDASRAKISEQIVELPIEQLEIGMKSGVSDIPRLIRNKTEVLSFQLGYGGYWGEAIKRYLSDLTIYPFFKYVVINKLNGNFFGLADARGLSSIFSTNQSEDDPLFPTSKPEYSAEDFANWLNDSRVDQIVRLPGFIGYENAINKNSDKQTALEQMEKLNVEILPVIDETDRFIGIVERSRLASSLIIEVANKLR